MSASEFDWSGFRGGPRRLSLNPTALARRWESSKLRLDRDGDFRLDGGVHDLLSWDGYLISIGRQGQVDLRAPGVAENFRFQLQSPPSCHACIDRSTLFVGRRGGVDAYSLNAVVSGVTSPQPRWRLTLPSQPVGALLVVGERLFANLAQDSQLAGVVGIERIHDSAPGSPTWLLRSPEISQIAGDRLSGRTYFLSVHDGLVRAHLSESRRPLTATETIPIPDLPAAPLGKGPIAIMGTYIFAELQGRGLFQIRPGAGTERLSETVGRFAINSLAERFEIRDQGFALPHLDQVFGLSPVERPVGQPVILRNFAFAAGLRDGRLRIHDWNNPPFHDHQRLGDDEISALASFGPYLAVGSRSGRVALFQVAPK